MSVVGVLQFPGTNCDRDVYQALERCGARPQWLWHKDHFDSAGFAAFVVPGGFSYGDYLRSGALAAHSPVVQDLKLAAKKGYPILGICNGFQVLCEAQLLPGALLKNKTGMFIDRWEELVVENAESPWIRNLSKSQLSLPIAHSEGCYYIDEQGYQKIINNGQICLRYKSNPNGSVGDIAGITDESKKILGLMPHPERALVDWMGGEDGAAFFEWLKG